MAANQKIPKSLPLLKEFVKYKGKIDLSNTVLFAVQHLLGSNVPLFLTLNKMGIDFSNMFVIGKIYSSNPQVVESLKDIGIYVHPESLKLSSVDLTKDYHDVLYKPTSELLDKAIAALSKLPNPKKLLVLDDGGIGIIQVKKHQKDIKARISAVEQTRSGAEIIRTLNSPLFPIINVAESDAKLTFESPYIATSVLKEMEKKLDRINFDLSKSDVLVVGYGAIGAEIAKLLYEKEVKVAVFDLDSSRLKAALESGLIPTDLEKQLSKSNLVIGAVGKNWLPKDFLDIAREGTVLVSASSSNVEFSGLKVENKHFDSDFERVHSDYKVKLKNGYAWVLNAGFPVNFDGSIDPIHPKIVQLTRALMLAGVYDSLDNSNEGLTTLNNSSQQFLVDKHHRFL